uniref:Translation initiation factor eIF2B subunit delta n=1 Tax=Culicoides sonorensis TaxID=179676 RepID=A0A336LY21_CULSO
MDSSKQKQMTQEEKLAARKAKKASKKEQKTGNVTKTVTTPKSPEKVSETKSVSTPSVGAAFTVAAAVTPTLHEQKKTQPASPKKTSTSSPAKHPQQKPKSQEKMSVGAVFGAAVAVTPVNTPTVNLNPSTKIEKSREEIEAERKAKKMAKQQAKQQKGAPVPQKSPVAEKSTVDPQEKLMKAILSPKHSANLEQKMENLKITETQNTEAGKTGQKTLTKAERRAIQEAQRAAKAQKQSMPAKTAKTTAPVSKEKSPSKVVLPKSSTVLKSTASKIQLLHKVKLFNHLYTEKCCFDTPVNTETIHPEIVRLGVQYSHGVIVGANARCIAFLNAMKEMTRDFSTPPQKEFSREFEALLNPAVTYLKQCRPLSVTMTNALRYIKYQLTQLKNEDRDETKREILLEAIDTYIRDQIEKAAQAISISVQEKIADGDVIMTYGCSSLIKHILEAARARNVDFRVIVVDARPRHEGQEMLKRLIAEGIDCTCVLINAVGFIMPEVTKVLLGAHALLANGYVMSRVGTAQIALIAKSFNVPVLVCCETHKFSERVQTDAFVYNEIGDPEDLVVKEGKNGMTKDPLANWESVRHLTPLNLCYDVTPPELVTAVVTEVAILPCTSVPVILRIKPSEVGY